MPRDSLVLTVVLGELVGFVWAVLATAEAFNFPDPGLGLLLLWPAYVVLLAAGGVGQIGWAVHPYLLVLLVGLGIGTILSMAGLYRLIRR